MAPRLSKISVFLIVEHAVLIICVIFFSVFENPTIFLVRDEAAPIYHGGTKVLRFNGRKIEQLYDFCAHTQPFECAQLSTPLGKIPIFVYNPEDDLNSKNVLNTGKRDPENLRIIMSEIRRLSESTFLDIGSNLGVYALTVASNVQVPAIAVDPVFQNMVRVCKSVQENKVTDNVTLVLNAVSDTHQQIEFNFVKGLFGQTHVSTGKSLPSRSRCDKEPLFPVMLDDLLPFVKTKSAILKIDVESHEYHVIKGGNKFFKEIDVPAIFMEWEHVRRTPNGNNLFKLMKEYGYYPYTTHYVRLSYDKGLPTDFDLLWLKRKL